MRRLVARRRGGACPDAGVYAILYAILVVVLLGMAAIVVDFAQVRSDRRLSRSATDSAAIGGAEFLNGQATGGVQPKAACLKAWDYLVLVLHIAAADVPAGRCSSFDTVTPSSAALAYCATANPTEIDDDRTVGRRTIRVAWPIPHHVGGTISPFLTPEIAPGSASQNFSTTLDGTDVGCDKLGVAVAEGEKFGLGVVLGASGTQTQQHSVALLNPAGGPLDNVAALNVLNPTDCESLVTTGGGQVFVGPVLTNGVAVGPGSIAVEALGTNSCNGGKYVIDPTTGGSVICASSVVLVNASSCDGKGIIQSNALDAGGVPSKAWNPAAIPANLKPTPIAEGAPHGWNPVTKLYGCNTSRLPCTPPTPNYIATLESAYGGAGIPASVYGGSQAPYTNPYPGAFAAVPGTACGNVSTVVVLAPGNWYANCSITVKNGGALLVQGGTFVVSGGISVSSGGCLVVNTAVSSCPASVTGSGSGVTTNTPPVADAIVFLRGGSIANAGALVMPQTFVYSLGASNAPVRVNGSSLTLWTAPGAGASNGSGRTTLEQACYDSVKAAVNQNCLNSRFSRLTYWSDYAAPSNGSSANSFNGQGGLNVVGVFFTPKGYFNFTGGGSYTAAAAQFWADQLNVNGGASVGLSPDTRFSVSSPTASIGLIR